MVTFKDGTLTKQDGHGQCYCAPGTGGFIMGRRCLPAAVRTTATNRMQHSGTVRKFIKPMHSYTNYSFPTDNDVPDIRKCQKEQERSADEYVLNSWTPD